MEKNQQFNDRLKNRFDLLSPQLLKAAQYISAHPYEVATRSLRYIAKSANLPPPTFSRLAVAMEYKSFEDLRETCRNEIKSHRLNTRYARSTFSAATNVVLDSPKGSFLSHQSTAAINNIISLSNEIDQKTMEIVVNKLIKANRVILIAGMSSRPFMDYMAYMASMIFDNWQVFPVEAASTTGLLLGINNNDVVIVLSKSPYARHSINTAKVLSERGIYVVGITDEYVSPLISFCSESFVVSTETPLFFTSHAATLVLIESIIGSVVANGGAGVRQRIASIEAVNQQTDVYYQV